MTYVLKVAETVDATSDLSDDRLYALFRLGNHFALRILIDRHAGMLRRMARNIVGDEHEAEDVVQDVFLTLWNRQDGWTPGEAKFSTWIYRVGVNKAIDHRRRLKARPEAPDVLVRSLDAAQDDFGDGEQQLRMEDSQLAARLRTAVARLPDNQKRALQLFYFEDQTIEQICVMMDSTEQSVRAFLKRGRQALREQVRREKKISPDDHHGLRKAS